MDGLRRPAHSQTKRSGPHALIFLTAFATNASGRGLRSGCRGLHHYPSCPEFCRRKWRAVRHLYRLTQQVNGRLKSSRARGGAVEARGGRERTGGSLPVAVSVLCSGSRSIPRSRRRTSSVASAKSPSGDAHYRWPGGRIQPRKWASTARDGPLSKPRNARSDLRSR